MAAHVGRARTRRVRLILEFRTQQRRVDRGGRDGVDANAVWRKLESERLGQCIERAFGARISGQTGRAHLSVDRGNEQERRIVERPHGRCERLHEANRSDHVDVVDEREGQRRRLQRFGRLADRGRMDDDTRRTERRAHLRCSGRNRLIVTHVTHEVGIPARGLANIECRDLRTLLPEAPADRLTDAARRACHNRDCALQPLHRFRYAHLVALPELRQCAPARHLLTL